MQLRRALVFPLIAGTATQGDPAQPSNSVSRRAPVSSPLPEALFGLFQNYRLLVNCCVREAIASKKTSRGALSRFARARAQELRLNGGYGLTAAAVGLSLAKGHRRRERGGTASRLPYVRTAFLRASARLFHFDTSSGKIRLSLRRCEWVSFAVPVSSYHRQVLSDPQHRVTELHLNARRMVLVYEKRVPEPYAPARVVALDTNESSLDGVDVGSEAAQYVRISFPELREIQFRHFVRRRYLGSRKAHDRRVQRQLLDREGRRERHRVRTRLHSITRSLIHELARTRSLLVLEDLTRLHISRSRRHPGSRGLRRRLSSWPRAELHRQLAYKAAEEGVPVVWVDPYRSSRTCPVCGEISEPRRRVGTRFHCARCGWETDRQLNAGVNLARTVLRQHAELGGLRLDPDALSEDAVRLLYPIGGSRSGTGGAEGEGGNEARSGHRNVVGRG